MTVMDAGSYLQAVSYVFFILSAGSFVKFMVRSCIDVLCPSERLLSVFFFFFCLYTNQDYLLSAFPYTVTVLKGGVFRQVQGDENTFSRDFYPQQVTGVSKAVFFFSHTCSH